MELFSSLETKISFGILFRRRKFSTEIPQSRGKKDAKARKNVCTALDDCLHCHEYGRDSRFSGAQLSNPGFGETEREEAREIHS
jgi:hypothetical protein